MLWSRVIQSEFVAGLRMTAFTGPTFASALIPAISPRSTNRCDPGQCRLDVCSWQHGWFHHRDVREYEPRDPLNRVGNQHARWTSATEDTKSAGRSPLRLRVGVFLILLWLVPFWALSPYIAHSLSALSNPPSVAEVTTAILVMQTIFGLLGLWVAGTEVKAIVKGSTKRHAIAAIWSIFVHGEIRDPGNNGSDTKQSDRHPTAPGETGGTGGA